VGDIDGDGSDDALVGVIKKTRFHREKARRIFLFKQVNGKPRPLWMGSKLGGVLQDFRYHNGRVVSLEAAPQPETGDTLFSVAEWRWKDFGLQFVRFRIHLTDKRNALQYLDP